VVRVRYRERTSGGREEVFNDVAMSRGSESTVRPAARRTAA
jgi:hypothetical protein